MALQIEWCKDSRTNKEDYAESVVEEIKIEEMSKDLKEEKHAEKVITNKVLNKEKER